MEKNALALQQVHMHCDVQCVMIRCSPCLMQVSNSITMWHIETRKLCSTTDVNYEAHIIHTIQGSLGSVIVGPPDTHTRREQQASPDAFTPTRGLLLADQGRPPSQWAETMLDRLRKLDEVSAPSDPHPCLGIRLQGATSPRSAGE
jgi:hypothetical protein